jgi:hypothetical protein
MAELTESEKISLDKFYHNIYYNGYYKIPFDNPKMTDEIILPQKYIPEYIKHTEFYKNTIDNDTQIIIQKHYFPLMWKTMEKDFKRLIIPCYLFKEFIRRYDFWGGDVNYFLNMLSPNINDVLEYISNSIHSFTVTNFMISLVKLILEKIEFKSFDDIKNLFVVSIKFLPDNNNKILTELMVNNPVFIKELLFNKITFDRNVELCDNVILLNMFADNFINFNKLLSFEDPNPADDDYEDNMDSSFLDIYDKNNVEAFYNLAEKVINKFGIDYEFYFSLKKSKDFIPIKKGLKLAEKFLGSFLTGVNFYEFRDDNGIKLILKYIKDSPNIKEYIDIVIKFNLTSDYGEEELVLASDRGFILKHIIGNNEDYLLSEYKWNEYEPSEWEQSSLNYDTEGFEIYMSAIKYSYLNTNV